MGEHPSEPLRYRRRTAEGSDRIVAGLAETNAAFTHLARAPDGVADERS